MVDQVQYKQYSELDFEKIKSSLKTHLKSQDILKDFEFEGSTINVILNLLAYNTQYNSYYLNMLASEKFISTAQKRESIVGAANNIGYVPYSRKSSTAYLSFNITPNAGYTDSILIPKNVKFSSSIDGVSYAFLTTHNTVVVPVDGVYSVDSLEVKDGRFFKHQFTIASTDKFLTIPNKGIDYNRLTVSIKQSVSTANSTEYLKYTSLVDLNKNSEIYFIQETSNGLYQLYFGDGILGKALSVGNVVTVEYFVTDGIDTNGAREFTLEDDVTGLDSITFTSTISASGGAQEESLSSIRISAPTNYQAQNRATTELDFEVLVKQIYPDAKQVVAIGGERSTPKQYGKVFISILKNNLNILSDKDKNEVILHLSKKYAGLTVFPVIIDPYIVRMYINTAVKYSNVGISEVEVKSVVFGSIKNFVGTDLNSFSYTLRKSRFESMIDDSSPAILSNKTTFKLYIDTKDSILVSGDNFINFNQPVLEKTLSSSKFRYKSVLNCKFIDTDGLGFASMYTESDVGLLTLIVNNALSINYTSGIIKYTDNSYSLSKLTFDNSSGIRIAISTANDDIKIIDNQVIYVKDDDITITAVVDN